VDTTGDLQTESQETVPIRSEEYISSGIYIFTTKKGINSAGKECLRNIPSNNPQRSMSEDV